MVTGDWRSALFAGVTFGASPFLLVSRFRSAIATASASADDSIIACCSIRPFTDIR